MTLEINFDYFIKWRDSCCEKGESLVNESFSYIAKKHDIYLIANPVNNASYAHFIRNDVQSKTHTLNIRSEREGIMNGFIASASNPMYLSSLKFEIDVNCFYAVKRNGVEKLTKTIRPSDYVIKACCYSDGAYVVSDVDLLFILFKEDKSPCLIDTKYGELTQREKHIIESVNMHYQKLAGNLLNIISHGPANRFSGSKLSHIHFPIKIYSPSGQLIQIKDSLNQLLFFLKKIKDNGYYVHLNPLWNLLNVHL